MRKNTRTNLITKRYETLRYVLVTPFMKKNRPSITKKRLLLPRTVLPNRARAESAPEGVKTLFVAKKLCGRFWEVTTKKVVHLDPMGHPLWQGKGCGRFRRRFRRAGLNLLQKCGSRRNLSFSRAYAICGGVERWARKGVCATAKKGCSHLIGAQTF